VDYNEKDEVEKIKKYKVNKTDGNIFNFNITKIRVVLTSFLKLIKTFVYAGSSIHFSFDFL